MGAEELVKKIHETIDRLTESLQAENARLQNECNMARAINKELASVLEEAKENLSPKGNHFTEDYLTTKIQAALDNQADFELPF